MALLSDDSRIKDLKQGHKRKPRGLRPSSTKRDDIKNHRTSLSSPWRFRQEGQKSKSVWATE